MRPVARFVPAVKVLPVLVAALTLAGCSLSEEKWGGYTENQAKGVLSDPIFRREAIRFAPGGPGGGRYARLLPTKEQVEEADLRKVTLKGQEAWEYKDRPNSFCVYVWEDEETDNFATQVGPCSAD